MKHLSVADEESAMIHIEQSDAFTEEVRVLILLLRKWPDVVSNYIQ